MSSLRFKNFNNEFCVEIDDSILNDIKNECIKAGINETGGILIGKYFNRNSATIIEITGPTDDSKQSKFELRSGTSGLIELLDNKWDLGQYYIGEWHSHPNSSPQPSEIDDTQMKQLSYDILLKCPEPILLIIGGNQYRGWDLSLNVYKEKNRITLYK